MTRKPKFDGRSTAAAGDDAATENLATVATFDATAAAAKPAITDPLLRPQSKLDRLVSVLRRESGADMPAMLEATGWQAHSIRGALAGALKKRGHIVSSEKNGAYIPS
ncbi:MAG: DUF3489 domain-containing protein [Caulobacteraceae bacterium]|nr:DUF3489 domain-containing protein [Caulobacteraceae bacterium]